MVRIPPLIRKMSQQQNPDIQKTPPIIKESGSVDEPISEIECRIRDLYEEYKCLEKALTGVEHEDGSFRDCAIRWVLQESGPELTAKQEQKVLAAISGIREKIGTFLIEWLKNAQEGSNPSRQREFLEIQGHIFKYQAKGNNQNHQKKTKEEKEASLAIIRVFFQRQFPQVIQKLLISGIQIEKLPAWQDVESTITEDDIAAIEKYKDPIMILMPPDSIKAGFKLAGNDLYWINKSEKNIKNLLHYEAYRMSGKAGAWGVYVAEERLIYLQDAVLTRLSLFQKIKAAIRAIAIF